MSELTPQARRVLALPFDHPLFHGTPGIHASPIPLAPVADSP